MTSKWKIFILLLRKNYVVRRKHWFQSTVIAIIVPIFLVLLGSGVRFMTEEQPIIINHTQHGLQTKMDILQKVQLSSLYVRFTPQNHVSHTIMREATECLGVPQKSVIGAPDEVTMIEELRRDKTVMYRSYIGIVFEPNFNDTSLKQFKYKLRVANKLPLEMYAPQENSDTAAAEFGDPLLIAVQMCLDETYIKIQQPNARFTFNMSIQQKPYPSYTKIDRESSDTIGYKFSDIFKYSLLIILCIEISFPANEKYIGINILMTVNGVKNHWNLMSWLISAVIFSTFYLVPMVVIMKYIMPPILAPFILHGNAFLVWLALLIHICHFITFGVHLSSYFWKPSHGVLVTFIFVSIMNMIASYVHGPIIDSCLLYFGIISPNFLLRRMFAEFEAYERKLIGIQWWNIFTTSTAGYPPESNIGMIIIFSILGIILHFYMTVYVYAIRPGKYGIQCTPFYCFQRRKNNEMTDDEKNIGLDIIKPAKKKFENLPQGCLEPGIRIRGLKKIYTTGIFRKTEVHALRGVSVDFYKSEITALLGHNGAGKTTMMSILSGLTDATDGIVFIDGKNIQHSPDVISNNIGLCPQENMVFPDLNVQQQLMFFGTLKTRTKTKRQLEHEIEVLLAKVNLTDKRTALPNELSGGQKRRLCLAMAVIGDGNVLILDEPTSGMDAESKREVWDIVLKMRDEKTIIISTHDMEEADILGDRIAIMHTGKLKSYGTSMFLKKLYGGGQVEVTLSIEPWCNLRKIFEEIKITTQILSKDEGKIVLAIPVVDCLPGILDTLELSKKKLGITGMSVSVITLEQVFLKVTNEENNNKIYSHGSIEVFEKIVGLEYYIQTFIAFFLNKFTFARKNLWPLLISLLLPCLSVVLIVLEFGITPDTDTIIPLSLSLNSYSRPEALIYSNDITLREKYKDTIENFHGSGIIIQPNVTLNDALLDYAHKNIGMYRDKVIVSGEFKNITNTHINANGFYSGSATRSIPITINCMSIALLRTLTNNSDYSIEISAQTLPSPSTFGSSQYPAGAIIALYMLMFLTPAVALHVSQPLKEAISGVKQLRDMTGASKSVYWISTFGFDFLKYIVSILLLLIAFILVDNALETQLYRKEEIRIMTVLLILFGISVLPLVYLSSFLKKSTIVTIFILSLTPVILGFVDFLLLSVTLKTDNDTYKMFRKIQNNLFMIIPHVSLTNGYLTFFNTMSYNARCRRMPEDLMSLTCISLDPCCAMECANGTCQKPFSYFDSPEHSPGLQTTMLFLGCSSLAFFAVIFIIEKQYFTKIVALIARKRIIKEEPRLDETVIRESEIVTEEITKRSLTSEVDKTKSIVHVHGRKRNYENFQTIRGISFKINKKEYNDDNKGENIFFACRLTKNYGNFQAVKGISFRVKKGECFGLLGVNGAGKSTTFRMLTGTDISKDQRIYLKNYNIATDREDYLAEVGYCPQQDAIIETLNAWDHLYLFARLRGIPNNQIHSTVKKWIAKLNLTACAGQPSGTYSGGNKRRLNIAMALIGNPSLVLMDEPTTGVDPAARRSLWNTLKSCQDAGQSIILTSHSMEECEVLCNRLVIMVKGQLVCVGASQELKQRFGAGYNIHVKLSPNRSYADVQGIKQHIESRLTCKLNDENTGFIGYHITDPKTTWTIMYTMMNDLKSEYSCIEDFAVLSSTLEQLFIQFARASNNSANWTRKTDDSFDI